MDPWPSHKGEILSHQIPSLKDREANCKEAECRTAHQPSGSAVVPMMFEIELSIKSCNTYSEHACRFLAGPLIELQGHLDVFSLLISHKVVQMLADLPFNFRRCLGGSGFLQDVWRKILN